MNEKEHLLVVLMEECAEIAQRASKALRFGLYEVQPGQQEDNLRRLEREYADLIATAECIGLGARDEDKVAKREKLAKFMNYSRDVGTLTEKPKSEKIVCNRCGFADLIVMGGINYRHNDPKSGHSCNYHAVPVVPDKRKCQSCSGSQDCPSSQPAKGFSPGYACTKSKGHTGKHAACCLSQHPAAEWE